MKKLLLFCFCLFFIRAGLYSQVEILKTEKYLIEAQLHLSKDEFDLRSSDKWNKGGFLKIEAVRYAEREIQIDFSNLEYSGGEYYRLQMSATLDGVPLAITPENILGTPGKDIPIAELATVQTLTWTNLVEDFVELKGQLQMTLLVEIFGNQELPYKVNCGVKPTFTNKQKFPYLITALAGAGSLLAGQRFRVASAREYAEYLNQETFEAGEPIRLSANDKHHKDIVFTAVGAALLTGDVIWFLIRQRRYKKQMDTYRKFCNPSEELTLRPVFKIEKEGPLTLQTGLNLKLRF